MDSDGDDPGDGESGMDLTGFLFGNIDENGQLEDDSILDKQSKRMLSSLNRFGFRSMISEVIDIEEANGEDQEKEDYTQKSPSAIDFFDIEDAVEDVKVLLHVVIKVEEVVVSEKVEAECLQKI